MSDIIWIIAEYDIDNPVEEKDAVWIFATKPQAAGRTPDSALNGVLKIGEDSNLRIEQRIEKSFSDSSIPEIQTAWALHMKWNRGNKELSQWYLMYPMRLL